MENQFNQKSDRQIKNKVRALITNAAGSALLTLRVSDGDEYFILPGGTQEFGETAAETLQREMKEELECDVKVGSLVLVRELLAQKQPGAIGQVTGKQFLELYFVAEALNEPKLVPQGSLQEAVWLDLKGIAHAPLKPDYVRDNISGLLLPQTAQHKKSIYVGNVR